MSECSYFTKAVREMSENERFREMDNYLQHGSTTTLMHSIAVAYYSYRIASRLRVLSFRKNALIRGALLHDYYLYDWHVKRAGGGLHGYKHPSLALANAARDYDLTACEVDIIRKHMFPLTLTPPSCPESALVSVVDKFCSVFEVFSKSGYKNRNITEAAEISHINN